MPPLLPCSPQPDIEVSNPNCLGFKAYGPNPSISLINTPIFKEIFFGRKPAGRLLSIRVDFVWDKPPTFKGIFLGGVQKSVGRLLVLLAEMRSYSTSGICSLLFLIENQCRAMVQLLRNPAFLILGGGGPPPIKQKLGLS